MRQKPSKEHIILDILSRLASINDLSHTTLSYSELDALFVYHIKLVKIYPDLISHILEGYAANNWWAQVEFQILNNKKLDANKAILLFVTNKIWLSDVDPYFELRLDAQAISINVA